MDVSERDIISAYCCDEASSGSGWELQRVIVDLLLDRSPTVTREDVYEALTGIIHALARCGQDPCNGAPAAD